MTRHKHIDIFLDTSGTPKQILKRLTKKISLCLHNNLIPRNRYSQVYTRLGISYIYIYQIALLLYATALPSYCIPVVYIYKYKTPYRVASYFIVNLNSVPALYFRPPSPLHVRDNQLNKAQHNPTTHKTIYSPITHNHTRGSEMSRGNGGREERAGGGGRYVKNNSGPLLLLGLQLFIAISPQNFKNFLKNRLLLSLILSLGLVLYQVAWLITNIMCSHSFWRVMPFSFFWFPFVPTYFARHIYAQLGWIKD